MPCRQKAPTPLSALRARRPTSINKQFNGRKRKPHRTPLLTKRGWYMRRKYDPPYSRFDMDTLSLHGVSSGVTAPRKICTRGYSHIKPLLHAPTKIAGPATFCPSFGVSPRAVDRAVRKSASRSLKALFVLIIFSRYFSLNWATGGDLPDTRRFTTPCLRTVSEFPWRATGWDSSWPRWLIMRVMAMPAGTKASTAAMSKLKIGAGTQKDHVADQRLEPRHGGGARL